MMEIATTQSLQLFLRALQGQNFSPKTLRAYGDDLAQFLAFVEKNRVAWDSPTRFDRADIEGFMQYLASQRRSGVILWHEIQSEIQSPFRWRLATPLKTSSSVVMTRNSFLSTIENSRTTGENGDPALVTWNVPVPSGLT